MAAQLAIEALGAEACHRQDQRPGPRRGLRDLGIATICRTNLMADAPSRVRGLPAAGAARDRRARASARAPGAGAATAGRVRRRVAR